MKSSTFLEIRTVTWSRDTHGLFDYESRSITKSFLKTVTSCSIFRANQTCYTVADDTKDIHEGTEPLLSIRKNPGSFTAHQFSESLSEKLWLVVKYMKTKGIKGHLMHEGDWLKLGRVRFRVKKISINKDSVDIPGFLGSIPSDVENVKQEDSNQGNNQCRICLYETNTKSDPLINPCKCSGTMKYVHINCLKEWLKNKVATRQSERAISYYWKDLSCELCKTKLPSVMNFEGQKIELISMTYPTKSYILIEDYRPDNRQSHGLHVVSLDEGQFSLIGRGHECDLKLSDISVSRHHARIKFVNNQFIIEDQNSKFGTLLQSKKTVPITSHQDVAIQVNRTVLHLSLKEPWSCQNFCRMCFSKQVLPTEEVSYLTQEGGNYDEGQGEEDQEESSQLDEGESQLLEAGSSLLIHGESESVIIGVIGQIEQVEQIGQIEGVITNVRVIGEERKDEEEDRKEEDRKEEEKSEEEKQEEGEEEEKVELIEQMRLSVPKEQENEEMGPLWNIS